MSTKKQMDLITNKLDTMYDELDERLDNIEKVLILQEENLKIHMKRSQYLENIFEKMKENDLKPLSKHIHMVEGVFKFIGLTSIVVGIIGTIFSFFWN